MKKRSLFLLFMVSGASLDCQKDTVIHAGSEQIHSGSQIQGVKKHRIRNTAEEENVCEYH
jgi:hypothetical protein